MTSSELNVLTPSVHTVGNIVTRADDQTQVAIDVGILRVLPQLLLYPKSSIQKESAWALSNVAAGPHQHIQQLIACNILPPLVALLRNVSGTLSVYDKRLLSSWPCVELLQELTHMLRSKLIETTTKL